MASKIRGPRKQRPRQHVIADLSVHYVEGFILEAGHTAQRLGSDYGYDLLVTVRIRVPKRQAVNSRAVAKMRQLKWQAIRQEKGEGP